MGVASKELVSAVAESTGLTKKDAGAAIEAFVTEIRTNVLAGRRVIVKGLGKFARVKRAPRRHETKFGLVNCPKRFGVQFKAGVKLRTELTGLKVV